MYFLPVSRMPSSFLNSIFPKANTLMKSNLPILPSVNCSAVQYRTRSVFCGVLGFCFCFIFCTEMCVVAAPFVGRLLSSPWTHCLEYFSYEGQQYLCWAHSVFFPSTVPPGLLKLQDILKLVYVQLYPFSKLFWLVPLPFIQFLLLFTEHPTGILIRITSNLYISLRISNLAVNSPWVQSCIRKSWFVSPFYNFHHIVTTRFC